MPHMIIEYTSRVKFPVSLTQYLGDANLAFSACETVDLSKIKSRAYPLTAYCGGDPKVPGEYVYMNLRVLPGRPEALKDSMMKHMLNFMKQTLLSVNVEVAIHLSVELEELHNYQYHVQLPIQQRGQ